jgi:protein TonB
VTAATTAVDRVLAQRARRQGSAPWLAALGAAAVLHVLVTALFLFLPRVFHQPAPPMEFVPVTILPAAALGVPNPRRAAPPPPPEPEPAAEKLPALPAPEPEEPPKRPAREAPAREPDAAPPARRPPGEPGREEGSERGTGESGERRGSPGGSRSGTTAFGSEILADPDFTYGYYLDRLLSLIEAQWQRPAVGDGVEAMIAFTIERDGRVSELEVAKSSGMNAFDLAALRAVQNAAPFPRLPASYRKQALGVNLIVR